MPTACKERREGGNAPADRFLTEAEKASVLAAGYGELDPGPRPWLDRINTLPGICTIQSCAGHRNGELVTNGYLWLRMTALIAVRFRDQAFQLAAESGVTSVRTEYKDWGQEVVTLVFQGAERGRLDEALRAIFAFLARIAALVAPPEVEGFSWPVPESS